MKCSPSIKALSEGTSPSSRTYLRQITLSLYTVEFCNEADTKHSFDIFPDHLDFYLMGRKGIYRWFPYIRCILYEEHPELPEQFRRHFKHLSEMSDCEICLFCADQWDGENIWNKSQKNLGLSGMIDYLKSERYVEEPCEEDHHGMLYLPDFLHAAERINDRCFFLDAVTDDFRDLR